MKLAWRGRLSAFLCCSFALGLLVSSGCHNLGSPMQSATRVPPPGTGSYNLQGAYYNNPATATSSTVPSSPVPIFQANAAPTNPAPVVQASATSDNYAPAGANFPTTKFVGDSSAQSANGTNFGPSSLGTTGSSGVSPAVYTDNGNSGAQVIQASSLQSGDFNEPPAAPTSATNLQWQ